MNDAPASKMVQYQISIMQMINERIQAFVRKDLTAALHYEIYETIFNVVKEVMLNANAGVTNEFINFVAQHVYDNISLGGNNRLDPNIFSQRATVENLTKGEILLALPLMLTETSAANLIRAVKGR